MEEQKVAVNSYKISVKELSYKIENSLDTTFDIRVSERIECEEVSNDSFVLVAERGVLFDPDSIKLVLSLRIVFSINKEGTSKALLENKELMKDHLNTKAKEFYDQTNAGYHFSSIIAQVTSWFGGNPLLLPPKFEKDEN